MTILKNNGQNWEWTLFVDTFNNEIFAYQATPIILRSMSKVGTPIDNAIIEAINGWIKEELFLDFALATAKDVPLL